jgi:hypothetical protein
MQSLKNAQEIADQYSSNENLAPRGKSYQELLEIMYNAINMANTMPGERLLYLKVVAACAAALLLNHGEFIDLHPGIPWAQLARINEILSFSYRQAVGLAGHAHFRGDYPSPEDNNQGIILITKDLNELAETIPILLHYSHFRQHLPICCSTRAFVHNRKLSDIAEQVETFFKALQEIRLDTEEKRILFLRNIAGLGEVIEQLSDVARNRLVQVSGGCSYRLMSDGKGNPKEGEIVFSVEDLNIVIKMLSKDDRLIPQNDPIYNLIMTANAAKRSFTPEEIQQLSQSSLLSGHALIGIDFLNALRNIRTTFAHMEREQNIRTISQFIDAGQLENLISLELLKEFPAKLAKLRELIPTLKTRPEDFQVAFKTKIVDIKATNVSHGARLHYLSTVPSISGDPERILFQQEQEWLKKHGLAADYLQFISHLIIRLKNEPDAWIQDVFQLIEDDLFEKIKRFNFIPAILEIKNFYQQLYETAQAKKIANSEPLNKHELFITERYKELEARLSELKKSTTRKEMPDSGIISNNLPSKQERNEIKDALHLLCEKNIFSDILGDFLVRYEELFDTLQSFTKNEEVLKTKQSQFLELYQKIKAKELEHKARSRDRFIKLITLMHSNITAALYYRELIEHSEARVPLSMHGDKCIQILNTTERGREILKLMDLELLICHSYTKKDTQLFESAYTHAPQLLKQEIDQLSAGGVIEIGRHPDRPTLLSLTEIKKESLLSRESEYHQLREFYQVCVGSLARALLKHPIFCDKAPKELLEIVKRLMRVARGYLAHNAEKRLGVGQEGLIDSANVFCEVLDFCQAALPRLNELLQLSELQHKACASPIDLTSCPIFFKKFTPDSLEERYLTRGGWYTDDAINELLAGYLRNLDDGLMVAIRLDQHGGTVLEANLRDREASLRGLQRTTGLSVPYIVLPVNLGNRHWTALLIDRRVEGTPPTIYYLDPLGSTISPELINLLHEVYPAIQPSDIKSSSIILQRDGRNCGPWIIAMLTHLVEFGKLPPENFDIEGTRKDQLRKLGIEQKSKIEATKAVTAVPTSASSEEAPAPQPRPSTPEFWRYKCEHESATFFGKSRGTKEEAEQALKKHQQRKHAGETIAAVEQTTENNLHHIIIRLNQ